MSRKKGKNFFIPLDSINESMPYSSIYFKIQPNKRLNRQHKENKIGRMSVLKNALKHRNTRNNTLKLLKKSDNIQQEQLRQEQKHEQEQLKQQQEKEKEQLKQQHQEQLEQQHQEQRRREYHLIQQQQKNILLV